MDVIKSEADVESCTVEPGEREEGKLGETQKEPRRGGTELTYLPTYLPDPRYGRFAGAPFFWGGTRHGVETLQHALIFSFRDSWVG
jgi:hypothetical protein